jgi:hypothetical protein
MHGFALGAILPGMLQLLALLAIVSLQAPELTTLRETYPGGAKRCEYQVDEAGARSGSFKSWHADGSLESEGGYAGGARDGAWTFYHPGGEVEAQGAYFAGERGGVWLEHYPDATAMSEGSYRRGFRHGRWKYWKADGAKDNGRSRTYKAVFEKDAQGRLLRAGEMVSKHRHGRWRYYWISTGKVQFDGQYERGVMVGDWVFRHSDGSPDLVVLSGTYVDGRRSGPLAPELQETLAHEIAPGLDGLPALVDASDEKLGELSRQVATVPSASLAAVREQGHAAIPAIIQGLVARDIATPEGDAAGKTIVEQCLAPLFHGHGFAWTDGLTAEALAQNRTCIRRWHSAWSMLGADRAHWLELWEERPAEAGTIVPLLLHSTDVTESKAPAVRDTRAIERRLKKEGVDDALADALDWLARHQQLDGSWDTDGFMAHCTSKTPCDGGGDQLHDVGITGLATLALLGAGPELERNPRRAAILRALEWLRSKMDPKTGLVGAQIQQAFLYDHAVATLALAVYAREDPSALPDLQRAVDYVLRARNPNGAWRYDVPPNGENDVSLTGWMLHALHAAERAGVRVPAAAYEAGVAFIDEMTDASNGRVGYVTIGGRSARIANVNDDYPVEFGEAMTAVGLFSRFLVGQTVLDSPRMQQHADLMLKALPAWHAGGFTPEEGCNDIYYWYHGTYAMFQMGDAWWDSWNRAVKKALVKHQREGKKRASACVAGSFDPDGPWGFAGGRIYATALAALCMEVYHRYPRFSAEED